MVRLEHPGTGAALKPSREMLMSRAVASSRDWEISHTGDLRYRDSYLTQFATHQRARRFRTDRIAAAN
jgi:hypothetical protein